MKVILASASPRRRELIKQTGVDFTVIPSDAEEIADRSLPPHIYVERLAELKASSVAANVPGTVLGADTVVVFEGEIIGKPSSRECAVKTLKRLSGKCHMVITGYCVIYGENHEKRKVGHAESKVYFNDLSNEMIEEYVATGLPMDKAGSYGVQDGFPIVAKVDGSLSNVIGLPVEDLTEIFKEIANE